MGLDDHMGMSQMGGYDHCQYPDSQLPELTAFVERFLVDSGGKDTHVMKTDGNFAVDRGRWISWEVPDLR